MGIYLDNGATSFPKPKAVEEAVLKALTVYQGSANRSNSSEAHTIERLVYDTRVTIAEFFNFNHPDHVIFTKNVTESINLFLQGFLTNNDHVVITALEHNAVLRPLEALKITRGIKVTVVPCDLEGQLDLVALEKALQLTPKLVIVNHASNVSGDIQDIKAISQLTHEFQVPLFVDVAQSAGVLSIDMIADGIDVLAFTGHKSLLGPQGIGGILMTPKIAKGVTPLIFGGTGSMSEHFEQPEIMPDKFESGTNNSIGILGIKAGIEFLKTMKRDQVRLHEVKCIEKLQYAFQAFDKVRVIGNQDPSKRLGILSIDLPELDNAIIAYQLSKQFGITTRVGLHCAPLAHQTYGTYPKGTIRFSTSIFTTNDDIEMTIIAMNSLLKR